MSKKRGSRDQLWFPEYRGREVEFIQEILGQSLWEVQRYATEALFLHGKISFRASHGPGKTFWVAVLALTFLLTRKDSIVITTAPTGHQVKNLLWAWVGKLHADAKVKLPGEPDQVQYRLGSRWYALGISTDKPARFQGFHGGAEVPDDPDADIEEQPILQGEALAELAEEFKKIEHADGGLLFIFDEAAGISQAIYNAAKGAFTSPETYVVLVGNPDLDLSEDHEFVNSHLDDSDYHKIKVAADESPNDPLTPSTLIPGDWKMAVDGRAEWDHVPNWILKESWIEDRKRDYGVGTPIYLSKVLGQFASGDASNKLVPYELLVLAEQNSPNVKLGCHMGCDVSAGGDSCVASLWVDGIKRAQDEWKPPQRSISKLMETATRILGLRSHWSEQLVLEGYGEEPIPPSNIHVDVVGMGGGVCDRLGQILGVKVDRVDFGDPAKGDWRKLCGQMGFANRRAELHWVFRRLCEEGMIKTDRKWKDSWKQAQWSTYTPETRSTGSVILVEPKKNIRKRYKRSPDHFDSDLLAMSRTGRSRVYFGRR